MAIVGMNKTGSKFNKEDTKKLMTLLKEKKETLIVGGSGSGKFQTATYKAVQDALTKGVIKGNLLHALLKAAKIKVQDNSVEGLVTVVNAIK